MRTNHPLFTAEKIVKHFGGVTAVQDVSFDVSAGEIVGLIGPNGAGKTTLFNLIGGYLKPELGKVYFDGQDITGLKPPAIARAGIGRTFQIVKSLTTLTVLENVVVGALLRNGRAKAYAKAEEIINLVGLRELKDQLPGNLTIESRKRLELARALATEPKLLLLDEIFAGLTSTEVKESLGLIQSFADQGLGIIIIEHILQAVMSLANKIVVLDYGKKIAEGFPEEVVHNPLVIEAYLGSEKN
jgi:branched-chain amino acid transport system ATP-binding protein